MDERDLKLLKKRGIVVLPQEIEHDTYRMLLEALIIAKDRQVKLFCRGDGGCSRTALAMVDLIQHHGDVIGLLPGEANSSHVTIWAGCKERYVYPNGLIGLHKVAWAESSFHADSRSARLISDEFERAERRMAP